MNSGVYILRNLNDNKVYVGSSNDLKRRKREHFSRLRKGCHEVNVIQELFSSNEFIFEIIEYCDKSVLLTREQYYLDFYKSYDPNNGYNKSPKSDSSLGVKRSEAQIYNYLISRKNKYFRVYDLKKNLIGRWLSKTECARNLGLYNCSNIIGCLRWEKKTLKKYIFIYEDEIDRLDEKIEFAKVKPRSNPFMIYNLDGEILGIFMNQRECAKLFKLNYKNVNACLQGDKKTHLGFKFEYLE